MDELIKLYLECFYENQIITDKQKLAAKLDLNKIIKEDNISSNVLKDILLKVKEEKLNERNKNFLSRINKFKSLNIIDYTSEYFHPFLFNISKPKKYFNDEDILITESYTMKKITKDRLSINHILNYIRDAFPNTYIDDKKDNKIILHLLKNAIPERLIKDNPNISIKELNNRSLDILMFTIDACSIIYNDDGKKLINLISLSDFIETGIEMMNSKINCLKEYQVEEERKNGQMD